ncbi:MAG: right-handed parallel beta-helix repeat-containing protein [Proteiniphilum sp.]|uniref:right-handed parallel beta-helix repeat-containing protein n=1 Tax=Proteiniphilum sp. TaxID=1926877 RepID=UPI002B1FE452|nr:right-handed parallel beta-helix repeat-containing protein [Proteiniphilum sp.]MEA5127280.1 right-handed parallel beta-helix repeat-containing protein [Proteiniphilum sp.]
MKNYKTKIIASQLLLFIIIGISSICPIFSQIYVSNIGNDSNPGTYEKPLMSLHAAIEQVTLKKEQKTLIGDAEIILKEGIFYLDKPITITDKNWKGDNTLYIKGEKNNASILKGAYSLGRFEKISEQLWRMDVSEILEKENISINQLFVNGKRAIKARSPNFGELFKTKTAIQTFLNEKSATQVIQLTEQQLKTLSLNTLKDENMIASFNHLWLNTQGYVNNISSKNKSFSFTSPIINKVFNLNVTSQFFLENSSSFLDDYGEWFIDNNILFYIPRKGENINTTTAEVPVLDQLLIIKGSKGKTVNNIIIENLSFQLTKHSIPKTGQLYHQAAFETTAAITVSYATNIEIRKCEISQTGNNAIWFQKGSKNSKLTQTYMYDLGVGGVKIGIRDKKITEPDKTSNIVIDNNIIKSGGYEVSNGVGILVFNSGNNIISHNTISDFRYSGISVGWTWGYGPNEANNNKIINNHIHHIGWAELSDLGGIYILGRSDSTEIKNNIIHDVFSYDYKGWGIYLDEGSTNVIVENNLVYNCKSSGFHQHYGKDNIIRNNIFANQLLSQLEISKKESHNSIYFTNNIIYFEKGVFSHNSGWKNANFIADNNLYWDKRKNVRFYNMNFEEWKKTTGKDQHSVIADPLFRNPDQFDFRFKSNSNIDKIKFRPFDYTKAGVYGNNEWKKKAILDTTIIDLYNISIERQKKEEGIK